MSQGKSPANKGILLNLRRVCKKFGGLDALKDVTFDVPQGCVHGLIGPNGAGKTTIFNHISGVLAVTSGSMTFLGQELTHLQPDQINKLGIARTFQNIRLFPTMTVSDCIEVAQNVRTSTLATLLPFRTRKEAELKAKAEELLHTFHLWDKRNERCSYLPYADQRRLEIARALATEPKMILLDEPTVGMTAPELEDFSERVCEIVEKRGITILLIEHNMNVAMGCCHSLTVLNYGEKIAEGTPEEIQANPAVIEAYLGSQEDAV